MEKQFLSGIVTQIGAEHLFKEYQVRNITIETDQGEKIVIRNVLGFPFAKFENKHIDLFLIRRHSHMWTVMACKDVSGKQYLNGMLDTQWQNDYKLYFNDCIFGLILGLLIVTIPFVTIPKLVEVITYKKRRKEYIEIVNDHGFNIKDVEYKLL
jgi:hypothetical protein